MGHSDGPESLCLCDVVGDANILALPTCIILHSVSWIHSYLKSSKYKQIMVKFVKQAISCG